MEIRDWRAFYDSLTIDPMCGEPVPRPSVAQLDRFEEEAGFQLPRSYREYIQLFGPGRLFADWDVAAPGYGPSWYFDLHGMQANMVPEQQWVRRYPEEHRDRVLRCRYFCSKYKDAFGWDPAEVCDPDAHEYAVYRIVEDKRVIRVASSFRGFVEDAALDRLTYPGWDEEELGPRLLFEPAARQAAPGT